MNVGADRRGAVPTSRVSAPARAKASASSRAEEAQPAVVPRVATSTLGAAAGRDSALDDTAAIHPRGRTGRELEAPFSSIRLERKPGVRTSSIGFSGDVRST
jgi:hypothetical protein